MATAFDKQIGNRNFLSPVGFKFTLAKEPKAAFYCNSVSIPDIRLGTAIQPTYLKDIDVPGDKIEFGDFTLKFLVDENMENYMTIHNWIYGLGYPEITSQYKSLILVDDGTQDPKRGFSDGTLRILNSNYRDVALVKFKDLFPVALTSIDFDSTVTDITYFTAEATFKYTVYDILTPEGTPL